MIRARMFFVLGAALFGIGLAHDLWDRWVDDTRLPAVLAETSVEVRDRNSALLRAFPVENGRQRLAVDLAAVDPRFVNMLVAYEDQRFHDHGGVDMRALLRAAGQALWHGKVVSGGSTLSMQAARLLENSGTGKLRGKLRQMRVAWALERKYSKDQILTLYLQHAPYGGAIEGITSGARAWFGKPPARLSDAEAALLIALPQAPELRRPDRHQAAARVARDRVLQRLDKVVSARDAVPDRMVTLPLLAPHLSDHLRAINPTLPHHDTTLDAALQSRIEALARRAVRGQPRGVSAAIVVADHTTGEVRASVGSAAYDDAEGSLGFVDMTRAKRSPGSTLKPLIYGLAFDRGLAHPETLMADVPTAFGRYAPQNFDGLYRGDITARRALQMSLNIPPVALTEALGPARLMASLHTGGSRPALGGKPGLAVALGGLGLSLNDLVQLYAGLAQGGQGKTLHWQMGGGGVEGKAQAGRMMSAAAAWQVTDILAGITPPAGAMAGPLAYKTGTSYGHRDAWAIGYDGAHVIGVWLGRPDGTPVPGAFGGELAAPVLFEAFGLLKHRMAPFPPPPPETLILPTAQLPKPLQRFGNRHGSDVAQDALRLTFPPDGAVLQNLPGAGLTLKLRGGQQPVTVLVNGAPIRVRARRSEITLPGISNGFNHIAVVDAAGQSAAINVRLMP